MKVHDYAIIIIWVVALVIIGSSIFSGVINTDDQNVKLMSTIITATTALIAAILNHALAMLRHQSEQNRLEKQKNYAQIVSKLGPFLRSPETKSDDLASTHLFTWVVGSAEVVEATIDIVNEVVENKQVEEEKVKSLLFAMREDIGQTNKFPEEISIPLLKRKKAEEREGGIVND